MLFLEFILSNSFRKYRCKFWNFDCGCIRFGFWNEWIDILFYYKYEMFYVLLFI